mgnify:CR=1 FL=1
MNNRNKRSDPDSQLYSAILKLQTVEECYDFFTDLCTFSELKAMEQRFELAKLLKANGYEVASYTGYTFEELLENGTPAQKQLLAALDILVDGEFVLAQRNLDLRFRGSENQRILDVPQSLAQGRAVWCTAARWVGERQA